MERQASKWGSFDWMILLITLVPIIASMIVYDRLPEQMVAHFDANFQPDRYQGKFSLLLTVGGFSLMPTLFRYIRFLDPKKANYEKFARAFNMFRLALALVLSVAYGALLTYNLGYEAHFNMRLVIFGMIGMLLMVTGNYMGQIRHNYLMGIRSPWTLMNEDVWRKTHRFSGPLYMLGGSLFLLAAFLPNFPVPVMIGGVILFTFVIPIAASYYFYRNISK